MTKPTNIYIIGFAVADLAHPVERHLAKVKVASSSLVIRSINKERRSLVLLLFLFFGCGMRDSKRPLRSKEQSGGLFVGRVRVGERKSEPSESRNPLQTKTLTKIGECFFVVDLCLPLNVRGGAEYNEAEGFYL